MSLLKTTKIIRLIRLQFNDSTYNAQAKLTVCSETPIQRTCEWLGKNKIHFALVSCICLCICVFMWLFVCFSLSMFRSIVYFASFSCLALFSKPRTVCNLADVVSGKLQWGRGVYAYICYWSNNFCYTTKLKKKGWCDQK